MSARRARSIVLLGMISKMPVPGVFWQTLHYLVGLRRLGYEVLYVEDHARSPSMFVGRNDCGSARASHFLQRLFDRFDLGDRWAFRALHSDGRTYGMSESALLAAYESADLILNLHGGTRPRPEHARTGRLVYVGTDPVQLEIELWQGREESFEFLDQHCAVFTFGENYGQEDCRLPVSDRYRFIPTRQPVVLDFWRTDAPPGTGFTTIANWHQPFRRVRFQGETYDWSKDREFRKVMELPGRTGAELELALSSIDASDRAELEAHGWKVTEAARFGRWLDPYREFIQGSRGEFTVAKDQNVRLRSGWFSDRSATYLAAGRPVVTQDTGFGSVLPVGEGLFPFSTLDEAAAAIDRVQSDPVAAGRGAEAVARDFFEAEGVLSRLLSDVGVQGPGRPVAAASGSSDVVGGPSEIPLHLDLEPVSRRPLRLASETESHLRQRPRPGRAGPSVSSLVEGDASPASVIVVTHQNLLLTRLCLEALLGSSGALDDGPPFEVVVVDNGSDDGTPDYLRGLGASDSRVRVILNPDNRGFAAACNLGARVASGDVLVFLNNDTVPPPGWLGGLVAHLRPDDVGAVNPVTNRIGTDAEIPESARTYGDLLELAEMRRTELAGRARDAEMLAFFCLAIRRERWDEIGPLDERFGIGLFEDDDYCARLSEAGYRLVCADDVYVHHLGEASFGRLVADGRYAELFERNRALFEAKWDRPWRPHEKGPRHAYDRLVERTTARVADRIPPDSVVAVVSRGDDRLLELGAAHGWHFPRAPGGAWAGHYPADGPSAVAHLDEVRARGARYLLLPATALWWLDHYGELRDHLNRISEDVMNTDDFTLFEFAEPEPSPARPVFIIGSPRSGTSILTWALGQHSNLYPLEETVWFGRFHQGLAEGFDLGTSRGDRSQISAMGIERSEFFTAFGRTVDELILTHREWPPAPVPESDLFARSRSPSHPKARWVDGTPENSFFVDGLSELFPDARFIHLLREPEPVVRSLRKFDRIGGRPHTTEEACERWLRHVRACVGAEEELGPERVLRVLHRDLASSPAELVRRCLEFVGEAYEPACLLPLSERINSSGTSTPSRGDAPSGDDPELIAEARKMELRLFGPDRVRAVAGEAR